MKNSSADPESLLVFWEELLDFLFSLGSFSDADLERVGWGVVSGGEPVLGCWLIDIDLVLGPTRVPNTRERSSTSACGGEIGEEKGGRI